MPPSLDAVVAGHICLDVIPDLGQLSAQGFQHIFRPGKLVEVGNVSFATGGPVANTGLALHRLGINTQLMGKLGADLYGNQVKRLIDGQAPDLSDGMIVDRRTQTAYTIVINPPAVDRIFLHFPGANDTFRADDIDYDRLTEARVFHFGYPPIMKSVFRHGGDELTDIFGRAKATGVTTSLDMSLPDPDTESGGVDWHDILTRTLPWVDIFLPSAEEITYMLDRNKHQELSKQGEFLEQVSPEHLSDMGQRLLDMGAKVVVIKLGHRGLYMRTGEAGLIKDLGRAAPSVAQSWSHREIWAPAFFVHEVGATGSGDAAIAGFLAALLRDKTPEEAVIAATAVGACNVEAYDGLSGIRTWPETMERIAAGWPKRELIIAEPGWRFDEDNRLWEKNVKSN